MQVHIGLEYQKLYEKQEESDEKTAYSCRLSK
jgi:hypothetical protein